MLDPARLAAALFIGPVVGSFVTNWALRRARQEQALGGRSRCEHCQETLGFAQTVPVLAYVVLGGRCAKCRQAIDPIHLLGEVVGGLILAFALLAPSPAETLARAGVGFVLLALAIIDLKIFRLPNLLTALVAAGGLALAALRGAVLEGLLSAAALVGVLLLLRRLGRRGQTPGIGLGDIKFAAGLGLWLGLASTWMMILAVMVAFVWTALVRPADRRAPFGMAMACAALIIGGLRDLGVIAPLFGAESLPL